MGGVTYDTGALVAAERGDRRMWAFHAELLEREIIPTIPAPVLAEAWRGGVRQANLSRLMAMCVIEPMTESQARHVGIIAGKAAHNDVVDVTVVEGAARRGDIVVTSDREHIKRIADAARTKLKIESV